MCATPHHAPGLHVVLVLLVLVLVLVLVLESRDASVLCCGHA